MNATLTLRGEHWQELVAQLDCDAETAGFLLAGSAADADELTLFGRSLRWIPEDGYTIREPDRLDISTEVCWPSLGAAHTDRAIPVFVHTHPGTRALPSQPDAGVDEALRLPALLRSRAPFYASLIVGGTPDHPSFTGRIYDADGFVAPLERLRVVGRRVKVLLAENADATDNVDLEVFDRQVRAFGKEGQLIIGRLRAGVVGSGGTGSAVFEQLVRDGFRDITIIDDDVITTTNVTRIHESALFNKDEHKVKVMEAAAERIGLETTVAPIVGTITSPEVAAKLRHLDVVFGCTDDEKGRLILSKLALTHLIPVFDMAFAVDPNDDGSIRGLTGRVTTLLPGEACLLCREHISSLGLTAEDLAPEERRRRAAEGYVPGLNTNDPSVGTFTTLVACFAVNELLDRLFGYSEKTALFDSTELLIRLGDRRVSYNSRPATGPHFCADETIYGRGDAQTA